MTASGAVSIAARSTQHLRTCHRRVAASLSTSGLPIHNMPWDTKVQAVGKRRVPVFCDQSADYRLRKGRAIGWANYNVIEEKRREEQRRKKIDQLLHKARCVNNAAEGQKILTELEKALEGSLAPTKGDEDIWSTCEKSHARFPVLEDMRALRAAIATLRKVLKDDDFQVTYHAQSEYSTTRQRKYGRPVQSKVMHAQQAALAADRAWKHSERNRAVLIDENLRNRARAASSHRRRTRKEEWLDQARDASDTNANAVREDPLPDQPWSHSPTRLVSKAKVFSTPANQASFDHFKDRSDGDEGYVWTAGGKCGSKSGVLRRLRPSGTGPAPKWRAESQKVTLGLVREDPKEPKDPDLGLRWSSGLTAAERKHHRKAADWYYD